MPSESPHVKNMVKIANRASHDGVYYYVIQRDGVVCTCRDIQLKYALEDGWRILARDSNGKLVSQTA